MRFRLHRGHYIGLVADDLLKFLLGNIASTANDDIWKFCDMYLLGAGDI